MMPFARARLALLVCGLLATACDASSLALRGQQSMIEGEGWPRGCKPSAYDGVQKRQCLFTAIDKFRITCADCIVCITALCAGEVVDGSGMVAFKCGEHENTGLDAFLSKSAEDNKFMRDPAAPALVSHPSVALGSRDVERTSCARAAPAYA